MALSKTTLRRKTRTSRRTKVFTSLVALASMGIAMAFGYLPSPLSAAPTEKTTPTIQEIISVDTKTTTKNGILDGSLGTPTDPPQNLRLAVIIANVPLATYLNPIQTPEFVRDLVFNQVNSYYHENSYGRVELTGDVFGMYTLPLTNERHCYRPDIENAIVEAARGEIDFSQYDRALIYYPYAFSRSTSWDSCNTNLGFATFPEKTSAIQLPITWVDSSYTSNTQRVTTAHELGHNFGLGHAGFLNCQNSTYRSTGCSVIATGDEFDVMGDGREYPSGSSALLHMNAPHKAALGWLDAPLTREIAANETGTFFLEPLETSTRGLKALKFPLRSEAYESLWVEYRQPVGADRRMLRDGSAGAMLHLVPTDRRLSDTLILDATAPASRDAWPRGIEDASTPTLHVGSSFQIPSTNSILTVLSATTRGMTVQVERRSLSPSLDQQPIIIDPLIPRKP